MQIPGHLSDRISQGEVPGEPIAQFEIGSLRNFVYLLLDWKTKKAAIVDSQKDLSLPLHCLQKHGFDLTHIIFTHTHFDHVGGLPQLIQEFPHVPVITHHDEIFRIKNLIRNSDQLQLVKDGDEILVGQLKLKVLHTPGHSRGECCYFLNGNPPYLFTGDTVFIRDCGRTDLESGSNRDMYASLQRIRKLPAETIILPGHHYQPECTSTLENELKQSPPFLCQSESELATLP